MCSHFLLLVFKWPLYNFICVLNKIYDAKNSDQSSETCIYGEANCIPLWHMMKLQNVKESESITRFSTKK